MIAQYNSINIDYQTAAAMVAEYNAAAATEMFYNEQVQDILDKYGIAEVAAAGIYTSKYFDRKALTSLGEWSSPTENHYYRRIYHLVSVKIIPELWDLSGLLLRYPHKAIYWGSYLAKTCTEVKSLCQQFESVVTNGTLSFSDINFLELNPDVAAIIQLSKIGDVDWRAMLNGMTYVGQTFSKESLVNDLEKFCTNGKDLATSGYDNFVGSLMGNSDFNGTFLQKAVSVCEVAQNAYDIYKDTDGNMENLLKNYWGDTPTAASLFDFSNYDMAGWVSDYLSTAADIYYRQRYYIACVDKGTDIVCNYSPSTSDDAIVSGGEWIRVETTNPSYTPTSAVIQQALSNSESYAGWSRDMVSTLNSQGGDYVYVMTPTLLNYTISRGGRQTKKAYAYSIVVKKSWNLEEVVHEETYDSYSMDLSTFLAKMNGYLSEFNENESGKIYQLFKDEKQYYEAASEAKVKGCDNAIITLTCSDNVDLGSGSTQYKCNSCSGSLNQHSKDCAMHTTLSESDLDDTDINTLSAKITELENQLEKAYSQLQGLQNERDYLEEQITKYPNKSDAVYLNLQEELQSVNKQILALQDQIRTIESDLAQVEAAYDAASSDEVETDDYYRIPAIMKEIQDTYRLTWQGEGWWSGYTFYRNATAPGMNGTVVFQATLSIARKPSYFLGIKIHRAILRISWALAATYTDTQIIDNLSFDSGMSDEEKARIINNRLSEISQDYPGCTASVEYVKAEDEETESESDDTQHLLWSSDRLAIAREVESRLMKIYADIVSMKKMLHYRLDILDVAKQTLPYLNDEQGKKQSMAERCRMRWLRNAADRHHSVWYNGKYELDDEQNE